MKKINLFPIILMFFVSVAATTKSSAQATISADTIKNMLIRDWQRAKSYTQEYMQAMPSDKYSFKATDSVRSFAQQLLHLAQANMFFVSSVTGGKPAYSGPNLETSATAQTADSVQYYVNGSYDFAISEIRKMPASSLGETKSMNMGRSVTESKLGWLNKAFEHQTHHRGQTTVYLRLAGMHPPQERLF
jgi:uncharacterized damage-inducible protein DinB